MIGGSLSTDADMQQLLRSWSEPDKPYQMDADSPGAAAYTALWRRLHRPVR